MADGRAIRGSSTAPRAIRVECYAGARADETPRRFWWEGRRIEVAEVVDRRHEVRNEPGWGRADQFTVRGADEREYRLTHDLETDHWYLDQRPGSVA